MRKLFLSLAACATMLSASATGQWQMGSNPFNVDTLYHSTIGPGMTTTGLRLSGADANTNTIKTSIHYTTIDLTNPNLEIRGIQAQDGGNRTETVLAMGNRKNAQGNGQYMAGVNADFFNDGAAQGNLFSCGHSLVDGTLYSTETGDGSWGTWASYVTVTGKKDVIIDTGVKASLAFKFPGGQTHSYRINGYRDTNYLVIYTAAENKKTNQWGRECQIKLISGSLENNDAQFEVTSDVAPNVDVPADGYVLSGHGDAAALVGDLKVGDKLGISSTVTYRGTEINPTQSVGGCSMIVMEGKVAPDAYFSSSIIDHFTSNRARTVVGYNKDRTQMIILVADAYSTNKNTSGEKTTYGAASTGFALRRMAQLMVNLGCYTAMNFDGGGSSQLYNKELGIRNVPYGEASYLRPVANGLFFVDTTPVDNNIAMIEVYQKDVKLATGAQFTPTVFGYNKYGVLVNKNLTGFSLNVASSMGAVSGTTFTAGSAAATTKAVVTYNGIKCGVNITTNSGKNYVTSGDDAVNTIVKAPYTPDEAMGIDKDPVTLTERWKFNVDNVAGDWDVNAPDWASEDAVKKGACNRFATARNGRFYTVDMRSMSIAEITPEGELIPLYKLPSLEGRTINGVPDYYGTAISSDDAGNFLIGHLFTQQDSYRVWTVYCPKTGKAKHFEIKLPDGEQSTGRIDNIGRVVGDLTHEAYAYIAPKATGVADSQKVIALAFKGASDGDIDKVNVEFKLTPVYLAGTGNALSICQPKYATVAEMEGKDYGKTFYCYSKAAGLGQWNQDLFEYENPEVNYCNSWDNYSRLNGFDTFLFDGKRYFVVHYSESADDDSGQHIIVMDENSTRVAEWTGSDFKAKGSGYNSITAVPVSSDHVNIYVYNCTGKVMAGALLTLTLGEYTPDEKADLTPAGLDFSGYSDGEAFKLTATETAGSWSAPAGLLHKHADKFARDGHLTVYLDRGAALDKNTQSFVDEKVQPAYAVRHLNEHVGNVLAINQQYAPGASRYNWPFYTSASIAQLNFYMDNSKIADKPDLRHYVRVHVVYNVLYRGCHFTQDAAQNTIVKTVSGIYATHENNWVVPDLDHELGARYGETGINFAQWVGETGRYEDMPANPQARRPDASETDAWDAGHKPAAEDANGYPAYILNDTRYRVYEFDTYMDKPSAASLSVQFNMNPRYTTFFIKEIRFTDLGTDEASATLLGRRKLAWAYYNEFASGIEDVVADSIVDAEDDVPAVYYNLQGVQIAKPENGIYIVRRGNKVTKELVR